MMTTVTFVDTTVLCNILPVPGRDQDSVEVLKNLKERVAAREILILPVTAIIETGNFIAQVPDGSARRATAEQLIRVVELVIAGKAPWRLHEFEWGVDFLRSIRDGAGSGMTFVQHAVNQVGAGDVCILAERELYSRRTGITDVRIWTRDTGLGAHD